MQIAATQGVDGQCLSGTGFHDFPHIGIGVVTWLRAVGLRSERSLFVSEHHGLDSVAEAEFCEHRRDLSLTTRPLTLGR